MGTKPSVKYFLRRFIVLWAENTPVFTPFYVLVSRKTGKAALEEVVLSFVMV